MTTETKYQLALIRKRNIEELEGNPVFLELLKLIQADAARAEAAHEDASLPAEKRAEWLWALKQSRELARWFDITKRANERELKTD